MTGHWHEFEEKCKAAKMSDAAILAFKANYDQLVAGVTGLVRLHFLSTCKPCAATACQRRHDR
jgi:hypothetical protein